MAVSLLPQRSGPELPPGMVETDGARAGSVKKTLDKRLMKCPAKRKSVKPCTKAIKKPAVALHTGRLLFLARRSCSTGSASGPRSHQRWSTCAGGELSGSDTILVAEVERQEARHRE